MTNFKFYSNLTKINLLYVDILRYFILWHKYFRSESNKVTSNPKESKTPIKSIPDWFTQKDIEEFDKIMEDPYWGFHKNEELTQEHYRVAVKSSKMPSSEFHPSTQLNSPKIQKKQWKKYSERDIKFK